MKRRLFFGNLIVGWLLLLAPPIAEGYLRFTGDPPDPSILTNPQGNAKTFLIIFYIIVTISIIALFALAGWGFRRMKERKSEPGS